MSKHGKLMAAKQWSAKLEFIHRREEMKAAATAKEILAGLAHKKLEAAGKPLPANVTGMYSCWVNSNHMASDSVGCIPPWTMVQKKLVNDLLKLWGPTQAIEVMTYIVARWIPFVKDLKEYHGAFNCPMVPKIEYLYRYRAEAINYWNDSKNDDSVVYSSGNPLFVKKNTEAAEEIEELQSIAIKDVEPKEAPATMEEILAILAELDSGN